MYRKSHLFYLLSILAIVLATVDPSLAKRDRPHIDSSKGYNILLSDRDTLLRGVSLSWDGGDPYGSRSKVMPSQQQLDALAGRFGLNALHLYLEGDSTGNTERIGYNAGDCDILVQRCADAGLYLIITIGCNGENGTMNLDWSQRFWEFYAPRYKDETHVIYEAHNEPVPNTIYQWKRPDWDDQAALYHTIRTAAPDTFILLGSFMGFVGDARQGVDRMESEGVDWSNAGLAHHGYESKEGIEEAISFIQSSTEYPALLCTEFYPGDTEDQGYNNMYERYFNGWMQFMWLGANDTDLTGRDDGFQAKIEKAGTIWTPDDAACNWPAKGAPSIPSNDSPVGIFSRGAGKFLSADSMNRFRIKADREQFSARRPELFRVEIISPGVISLKAANGRYLSAAPGSESLRANARKVSDTEKFICMELPNGDMVLRASGTGLLLSTADTEDGTAIEWVLVNAGNATHPSSHFVFVNGKEPSSAPSP